MAQPTNTFDGTDLAGSKREDLIDAITMTVPKQTPIVSRIGRDTAYRDFHEWQRDSLVAPDPNNALLDGDDPTPRNLLPTDRVGNHLQIFSDTIVISRRADKIRKAGQGKATAYQLRKSYLKIKRDMESMVLSKNPAVAATSSVAGKSAGLGVMVYTNALHNGLGATAAHTSGAATTAVTAGTLRPYTEGLVKTAMQNIYVNAGEEPDTVYMSPAHKTVASTFTGLASTRVDKSVDKRSQAVITGASDLYVSDFGTVALTPHYMMVGFNHALVVNHEYMKMAYLDGFIEKQLGKTGDSEKTMILTDVTLRLESQVAQAKIDDLTVLGV